MTDWSLSPKNLKQYPHFDRPLSVRHAVALATDPARVRSHGFFPFIRFEKRWTRFRREGAEKRKKTRHLRYAARGDSYIYSYYRHVLSERYEDALRHEGLGDNVIAYRKIAVGGSRKGGKCNIHFAKEAFEFIASSGRCCAVTLDISSYFDCIDHARLKATWGRLLGVGKLPDDHFQVYKSITSYAEVDRDELYRRLGFLKEARNGSLQYTTPKRNMPRQLCSPADFRLKVANDGPDGRKLISRNTKPFGIPQGAALSDLLANAYLLDFDLAMARYAKKHNGFYRRYSDDILVIVPGDGRSGRAAREYACRLIRKFGDQLTIKAEKTSTIKFVPSRGAHRAGRIGQEKRADGLEYLGFRFDGKHVYFRDSTLSNLNRKIARAARAVAHALVARYPGKDLAFITSRVDVDAFMTKFGRVEDFEGNDDYSSWTFWSYATKAGEILGPSGQLIFQQLKGQRKKVDQLLRKALGSAKA
jgi:hypothetical protein